jgi:hypothetical protein
MIKYFTVFRMLTVISLTLLMICCTISNDIPAITRVLVLSGKNNHEWQKTTPMIVKEYELSGLFAIDVTENPDTVNYNCLKRYDVILSNWNTWPDIDIRMRSPYGV